VNLDKVTRDDWIVAGLALLLVIDLLAFPWFDITVGAGAFSISATFAATGAPDGWLGVLALLAALAIIADLAIQRFSPQTTLPAIQGSRATTRFALAVVAAVFLALKFVLHIHFSLFGWGFYLAVLVAAALVFVTLQARRGGSVYPVRRGGPSSKAESAGPSGPPVA